MRRRAVKYKEEPLKYKLIRFRVYAVRHDHNEVCDWQVRDLKAVSGWNEVLLADKDAVLRPNEPWTEEAWTPQTVHLELLKPGSRGVSLSRFT